jgi:Bacterial PH domain
VNVYEHEAEPIPGLPGNLPKGEEIIWQGAPDWKRLALNALHIRAVALYFGALAAFGMVQAARGAASWSGIGMTIAVGLVGIGILALIAWGSARTTIYTLTTRRLVMRIGIALPTCINLPLSLIGSADLAQHNDGTGDIALTVTGPQRLGYIQLWPHARPWKLATPQPMLRGIPDAQAVAAMLARACGARLEVTPIATTPEALAA